MKWKPQVKLPGKSRPCICTSRYDTTGKNFHTISDLPLSPPAPPALRPRLVPWPGITETTPTDAAAAAAEIDGERGRVDVGRYYGLVVFAEDVDLAHRRFVQPGLDEGPDGGEEVGRLGESAGCGGFAVGKAGGI